jgi:L-alanine-DL-glutamate epimerase-like enolase superfamily enzyme
VIPRRNFLKSAVALGTLPSVSLAGNKKYQYFGRTENYNDFQIIGPGRTISKLETFTFGSQVSLLRLTTKDGSEGWGQISTYDADISATILHRKIARHVLGKDPANIDAIVDSCVEKNYKWPWSYLCRALSGVDTAIWDLYGKIHRKPVVELLGGKAVPFKAYGSSMSRTITPKDEATRLIKLRDLHGYKAFKVRAGTAGGHNRDAWPGRTDELIPAIRKAVGNDIDLLIDGNSCYTPDKALDVGKMLQESNYFMFEEPCPYWELEWTKEVTDKLSMKVSGGEQDNDLATWRRMIDMKAVDVVQPDPCYMGGLTRTIRVAKMAEKKGLTCVPHSANLALVTVFALHLLGAIPNAAPYLEYTIEHESEINKLAKEIYSPQLVVKDGSVQIPSGPGWGVKIHEDVLKKADYQKSEL